MASEESPNPPSEDQYYLGRVKWFNNKAGYGFITNLELDETNNKLDIFVHHTGIMVEFEQYRYLVQGEYVSFKMVRTSDPESDHEWQATDIKGVMRNKLMCETRLESKEIRDNRNGYESTSTPRSYNQVRYRGTGPRDNQEWTTVKKTTRPQSDGVRREPVKPRTR